MSDSTRRPEVHLVYVASVTHSGSTLLDLVLGSHSRLLSLGELKVLRPERRTKLERVLADRCTCGAPDKAACAFWSGVEAGLRETIGGGLRDLNLDHPDPVRFAEQNRALLETAVAVGGTPWLVDSSKSPRRLRRLLAAGFDVRPVHLTRSPYGVTYSHVRKGRSAAAGALRYVKTRLALGGCLAGRPHVSLRYEDFVAHPARETARVMESLDLAYEPGQLDWTAHPHHNICGNHMRFARTPEIRLDDRWRQGLSPAQKALVAALTWPALLAGR